MYLSLTRIFFLPFLSCILKTLSLLFIPTSSCLNIQCGFGHEMVQWEFCVPEILELHPYSSGSLRDARHFSRLRQRPLNLYADNTLYISVAVRFLRLCSCAFIRVFTRTLVRWVGKCVYYLLLFNYLSIYFIPWTTTIKKTMMEKEE